MENRKKPKPSITSAEAFTLFPQGLEPYDFQADAVPCAAARLKEHRAWYLAADPGLGKTIVAALIANRLQRKKQRNILYVCPPSLVANVEAEFRKWGLSKPPTIVPDSLLANREPGGADLVFVDEAHRFKNEKAQRTRGLIRLTSDCPRVVFLSGTPLPNSRPVELWTILKHFAPDVFGTEFFPFARKYCGARKTAFGWKFDGFTNRAEFRKRLFASFMLRLTKDLIDLPPLREGLLTVGDGTPPLVGKLEAKLLRSYSENDLVEGRITTREGKGALHLSEYLRHLGAEKLKHFFPILEALLTDTNENLLIFAHHKAVIDGLKTFLTNWKPIVIDGATPTKARHALVQKFQRGETRVAILNIVAGGIGHNMTKADRVLMLETSWRDGDNRQAGDRAHRIGREKPVLQQYVVLKDSFDAKRLGIVLAKRHRAV